MRKEIANLANEKLEQAINHQEKKLSNTLEIAKTNPEWVQGEEQEIRQILSLLYIENMKRGNE